MTKLGSQKLHICPKVTEMESIIGHRIDYLTIRPVALAGYGSIAHDHEAKPNGLLTSGP